MQCEKCQVEIPAGEEMELRGKTLCEDCYVVAFQPPKTCDVAAVHSAAVHRRLSGQTGTDGLTDLQKSIYAYVREQGKVSREDLAAHFQLMPAELERQFTVLRHCELLKGCKEGTRVLVTVMN